MYTKNLKAHRGTDNRILIEFVNQDQKPVDLTGMSFLFRLISGDGEDLLIEKPLEIINELKGQSRLHLTEQDLDGIQPGLKYFSTEQINNINEPAFVDDSAGARGNIDIVDSVMPEFISSKILTIPDDGLNTDYNTSIINTEDVFIHTFQIMLDDFTGTITVQGATDTDDQWYDISSQSYTLETIINGINVNGYHPYLRFSITNNINGSISEILYR